MSAECLWSDLKHYHLNKSIDTAKSLQRVGMPSKDMGNSTEKSRASIPYLATVGGASFQVPNFEFTNLSSAFDELYSPLSSAMSPRPQDFGDFQKADCVSQQVPPQDILSGRGVQMAQKDRAVYDWTPIDISTPRKKPQTKGGIKQTNGPEKLASLTDPALLEMFRMDQTVDVHSSYERETLDEEDVLCSPDFCTAQKRSCFDRRPWSRGPIGSLRKSLTCF